MVELKIFEEGSTIDTLGAFEQTLGGRSENH
jgi:hypothetical protein